MPGCGIQRRLRDNSSTASGEQFERRLIGSKTNAKRKWGDGKFRGIWEEKKRVDTHSNRRRKIIIMSDGQKWFSCFSLGPSGPTTFARRWEQVLSVASTLEVMLLKEEERNLSTRYPFLSFWGWLKQSGHKITSGQRKLLSPNLKALWNESPFCREPYSSALCLIPNKN